jgi:hypothetical protein
MKTTLNKIYSHNPCECGWKKLINYLGKSDPDDEPLKIKTILESNGIKDAIWALRAVDGHDREIRLFACWCACQSLDIFESQYFNDIRPRKAIETAACFSEGLCSIDELAAARAAAEAAVGAATEAVARAIARAAAWAAAWAAEAVARAAAWAAEAVARAAAEAAAEAAVGAAAEAAARAAAWAAVGAAAEAEAGAAGAAAGGAAGAAAEAAAWDAAKEQLLILCNLKHDYMRCE